MKTIYLDNAATSFPKPEGVSTAMKDYIDRVGATINRSVYGSAQDAGLLTSPNRAAFTVIAPWYTKMGIAEKIGPTP